MLLFGSNLVFCFFWSVVLFFFLVLKDFIVVWFFLFLRKNIKVAGERSRRTWGRGRIMVKIYLNLKTVLNNKNCNKAI